MSTPPQIPGTISADGSELWEWAGRASQFIHREIRAKELRAEILKCGTECGNCSKWMKSRECPRERPGTGSRAGFSVGPSMTDYICSQFIEAPTATAHRERLKAELQSITR